MARLGTVIETMEIGQVVTDKSQGASGVSASLLVTLFSLIFLVEELLLVHLRGSVGKEMLQS